MPKQQSTARELIAFSLPLILSGILQQLYSWADAFIVGRAEGELQLAAVGATSSISYFLINTILGLTLGLSLMAAQHFGRKDTDTVRRILSCFLPLLTALYAVLSAVAFIFAAPLLRLMDTPADIFDYSLDYLKIIFIGIPFLAVYNLFAGMLRAVGNTKAAFYAVLLSSVLNVALDVVFIVLFGWGVAGAAFATVVSQMAMTAFI
ncbi:MAG: polysaccharide biosynthesis C-terminal domain-containing protein, partial [Clostridia bacterium]|nr:polysaccharide biosynthesis C-terminal domain-containing protein [Clostridia bacterium]